MLIDILQNLILDGIRRNHWFLIELIFQPTQLMQQGKQSNKNTDPGIRILAEHCIKIVSATPATKEIGLIKILFSRLTV